MVDGPGAAPATDKQSCATCHGAKVAAVNRTVFVVYLRCGECGATWAIPERRQNIRPDNVPLFH